MSSANRPTRPRRPCRCLVGPTRATANRLDTVNIDRLPTPTNPSDSPLKTATYSFVGPAGNGGGPVRGNTSRPSNMERDRVLDGEWRFGGTGHGTGKSRFAVVVAQRAERLHWQITPSASEAMVRSRAARVLRAYEHLRPGAPGTIDPGHAELHRFTEQGVYNGTARHQRPKSPDDLFDLPAGSWP